MITHLAMFRWKEGTTPEQVAAFADALEGLIPDLPMVRSFRHGSDIGSAMNHWDYGVVAEFDSLDDYRAYSSDPRHLDIAVTLGKPIAEESSRVQFESQEANR
jgi:hypothetical protein